MAKLKSVKLQVKFNISYNTHPVTITHNGLSADQVDLQIDRLDQKETFELQGFSPEDPGQKVTYTLEYNQQELDIRHLTSFKMQKNKLKIRFKQVPMSGTARQKMTDNIQKLMQYNEFIENHSTENCNEIFFNGKLKIEFNKAWFQRNILSGANIDDGYVNVKAPDFKDETIFCVGDSRTYGQGVADNETWPSMLDGKVFNFGSKGLSHDGCLVNTKYILQNSSSVRQIICLLPSPTRKLFQFEFLGCHGAIPMSYIDDKKLPSEFSKAIQDTKDFIFSDNINEHWIKNCFDIIDLCNKNNVDCWLTTWDHDMHQHIPLKHRLPVFPKYETFKERASDGLHPHRKHYELFVKNIKPYIEKNNEVS